MVLSVNAYGSTVGERTAATSSHRAENSSVDAPYVYAAPLQPTLAQSHGVSVVVNDASFPVRHSTDATWINTRAERLRQLTHAHAAWVQWVECNRNAVAMCWWRAHRQS